MRFFKYLIFFFLSIFVTSVYSASYKATRSFDSVTSTGSTALSACRGIGAESASSETSSGYCYQNGLIIGFWALDSSSCTAGATRVTSGSYRIQNWKNETELFSLMDQSAAAFAGTTVCANSCIHNFDYTTNTSGDESSGYIVMSGSYLSTAQSCTTPTSGPTGTLNGTGSTNPPDGGDGSDGSGGNSGGCTTTGTTTTCNGGTGGDGGQGGSGTGGQGGQGGKGGDGGSVTVDMAPVVSAINSASTSIKESISSLGTSISNKLSQVGAAITDTLGITNGKLDAVKAEQQATTNAVNALKAEQQSTTNAVNAVKASVDANTSAVNANGEKVKSAVDANTAAVNASADKVKTAVDDNTKAVNAVKSSVDANTEAVNASGEKVKSAVDANTQAVNVNTQAVNGVKASVDANTEAVNANGDKVQSAVDANTNAVNANGARIKGAVDANTQAVNANGEKLDGIKGEIEKTNGILDDIKAWLTDDVDTTPFEAELPEREITQQTFKENIFGGSAQCPADKTLSMPFLGRSFSKTFSFEIWCDYLSIIGYFILISSYFYGAHIITRNS